MKISHPFILSALFLGSSLIAPAASHEGGAHDEGDAHAAHGHGSEASQLIAAIRPVGDSNVMGSVLFQKIEDGVRVTAKIGGLEPNAEHAFHIHEFGDITADDGTSAGGHFNPEGHDHGLPDAEHRHAGDLGNLTTDGDGNAEKTFTVDNVSLTGGKLAILGRSVVVHAKKDDGGQPTGNAGPRIGIGVIGLDETDTEDDS